MNRNLAISVVITCATLALILLMSLSLSLLNPHDETSRAESSIWQTTTAGTSNPSETSTPSLLPRRYEQTTPPVLPTHYEEITSAGVSSRSDGAATVKDVAMYVPSMTNSSTAEIQIIYAACGDGGLRAYSSSTSRLVTVGGNNECVFAVTYDFIREKVYFAKAFSNSGTITSIIYRADPDGNSVETFLNTVKYGHIYGLTFDWIANNVFAVTIEGFIIACSGNATSRCAKVLTRQKNVEGIAVDPIHGRMYWTEGNGNGSIGQAVTDGTGPVQIISSQHSPHGIVIDFEEWRLYWTCQGDDSIRSSNMNGRDMRTIRLPRGSSPQGIAVSGGRIYWTERFAFKLQSAGKDGQDTQTSHTGLFHLYHLALASTFNPQVNRTIHCESHSCYEVCVLTGVSFCCLS